MTTNPTCTGCDYHDESEGYPSGTVDDLDRYPREADDQRDDWTPQHSDTTPPAAVPYHVAYPDPTTPGEQWDALIERALPTDLQPIIAALEEAAEAEERIHWSAAQAHDIPAAHYARGCRDGLRTAAAILRDRA
jgi:hypothetical protein